MQRMNAEEYRPEFDAFMAGEVIESVGPEIIGCLPSALEINLRSQRMRHDYHARIRYEKGLNDQTVRWEDPPDVQGYDEASEIFCRSAEIERTAMHISCGRFSRRVQRSRDVEYDPANKHFDTTEGSEEFEPVFTSLLVVGAGTIVHVGKVRRVSNAVGTVLETVSGRSERLRSGFVYRLKPITAHWEPKAPIVPTNRYFWNTFH